MPVHPAISLGKAVSDTSIWEYAKRNSFAIVSKDTDFSNRIMPAAPPPWVVHLQIGNMRKKEFHKFLQNVWPQIESLLPAHKLVNIYLDRIEAVQ
ncbi:MAG TPA: DUF5615 family PIN-like protein [Verrucomicrobiae bacterium]|nr:DUF5615 family PIN-like protein [Verrucomicrobiae bacterium]